MATVNKLLLRLTKFSNKTSTVLDVTQEFNASEQFYQDLSGWDECIVQVISPSAAISFYTTNDNGSVTGELLPVPEVPYNWIPVLGTNLQLGTTSLNVSVSANFKFDTIGKYLGFFSSTPTTTTSTTVAPTTTTTTTVVPTTTTTTTEAP